MTYDYEYYRKLFTSEYRFSPKYMDWGKRLLTFKLFPEQSQRVGVNMYTRAFSASSGVFYRENDESAPKTIGVKLRHHEEDNVTAAGLRSTIPIETVATTLINAFDLDAAVGLQLDAIGTVVGVDRMLKFTPTDASPLMDDKTYRLCIKAGIIKNLWKGSAKDLVDAWFVLFPETPLFEIQDNQDMTFNVVISGNFTLLEREIIANGYIIPKPEGVRLNLLTIVDLSGFPLFAYEYDTLYMSGYGSHWATNTQGG